MIPHAVFRLVSPPTKGSHVAFKPHTLEKPSYSLKGYLGLRAPHSLTSLLPVSAAVSEDMYRDVIIYQQKLRGAIIFLVKIVPSIRSIFRFSIAVCLR